MDPAVYFSQLEKHDWYYNYSDDHRVWTNGSAQAKRLQAIAQENPILIRMLKDYSNWVHMPSVPEVRKPELKDYLN